MLSRDLADICTADGYFSAACVPERCRKLCNSGFSAARRANQGIHGTPTECKINAVEHFRFAVSEAYIFKAYRAAHGLFDIIFGAFKLRRRQNRHDLSEDSTHLCKVVREFHAAYYGRNKAHCNDYDKHEFICFKRSVFHQQTADRQYRKQSCRHNVHGKCKIKIALVHPVDIALRTFTGSCGELFVGAFRLAEYLYDLNSADIFNCCIIERFSRLYRALIIFLIACHHQHEKYHAQRQRDK